MATPAVCLPQNVNFSIDSIAARTEPRNVLLCSPEHFDIVDVKNVHMEGNEGNLDRELARQQWQALKSTYDQLAAKGLLAEVMVIPGAPGCEDMVFCANQTFPWQSSDGEKLVVLSRMRHESRQREVPHFEAYFEKLNYTTHHFSNNVSLFEGMGDTIPHYGKQLLYGGYGHRSEVAAYQELVEKVGVPIVCLELINPKLYHLDTCFIPIDEDQVLLCPDAFTAEGLATLRQLFKNVIEIPLEEADGFFSLNAHIINDKVSGRKAAILQSGSTHTAKALKDNGFEVIELDTSEYMKSGGSVFCMKIMIY